MDTSFTSVRTDFRETGHSGRSMKTHVAHLVYQFSTGGLENVVTQLINELPHDRFTHSLIAVGEIDPLYLPRITRKDVNVRALHKGPGQPFKLYPRMRALLRELQPDVLHSCNLAALDFVPAAAWAGVPRRVHAEHGWSADDAGGTNRKRQWLRRLHRPWVSEYVAVSQEISHYLHQQVGVPAERIHVIPNGIDLVRFRPATTDDRQQVPPGFPFDPSRHRIVGTVGRMEPVKNHRLLLDAMGLALKQTPAAVESLRLVMVGDGPLRTSVQQQVQALGLQDYVWLAGNRSDIPDLLRAMDMFVLCSLAEGTSCALQEAMACGLDVIATDVGGNRQLLADGAVGTLVPSGSVADLARELGIRTMTSESKRGTQARGHAESNYALATTIEKYADLFTTRRS
jgi:sugar transferase (PEP-CTERM/EpsH1 system associated)